MGIYLYDHDRDGAGLWVRESSHRCKEHVGPIRDTAMRAGSIVVFDVRITHRGLAKTRFQRGVLQLSSYLPRALHHYAEAGFAKTRMLYRAMIGRERLAIVFSVGIANHYTLEFAKRSMRRQIDDTPGTSPLLPPRLRKEFEADGVLLAEDYFDF